MDLKESEILIKNLEAEKSRIEDPNSEYYEQVDREINRLKMNAYQNLSAWDRIYLARHPERPRSQEYINIIFDDFIELHGDRKYGDDRSIIGGIASFHGVPVSIIAQSRGKTVEENLAKNFGMNHPEAYRKVLRLAKQAEKFKRPIITFVDTPGAYPGVGAEERGQAEAIASCLFHFSTLKVPIICVVLSEAASGGALALSLGDRIVMLENSIFSILSPEGFASILWKDESRAKEAAELMKLTASDLKEKDIIDEIIKEPLGGAQAGLELVASRIDQYLLNELKDLCAMKTKIMIEERYNKFRRIGVI